MEPDLLLLVQARQPDALSSSTHTQTFQMHLATYKVIIKQHDELRNEALDQAGTAAW